MKIRIHTQGFVKKTDCLPAEFIEYFEEHLHELARTEGCGNVMQVTELSDLVRCLIEEKEDHRYVDALRNLLGVCRDNSVNELIFDD